MAIKKPLYWLIALTFLVTTLSIGQALAYARTESHLLNPPSAGSTSKWIPGAAIYESGVFQDTDGPIETATPTVISFDPADDTTGVATDANLVITFNENVVEGTGNIVIYNSDDSVFEIMAVTDAKVSISGNVVTINPAGTFTGKASYYVQISATCFKDTEGNFYAGISDKTTWNFTSGMPTEAVIPNGEWVIVDRILLTSFVSADPSGNVILWIDSGTEIICSNNESPEKLSIGISEKVPSVPDDFAIVSPVYDLVACTSGGVPQPVSFDPPIRLQIKYDSEELPENTSLVFIAYYDEELGWVQLEPPSGFVAEVGTAEAQVSHFTSFAVIAQLATPAIPARFEIRDLVINPIEVMPGESVTISAWLINVGGLSGEHVIKVSIDGLLETSQVTRLSPEQSQKITFTVTPASPGSYKIEIDDLRSNFVVKAIPTPAPTPSAPVSDAVGYGWLIAIISAVVAIVALMFVITRERLQRAAAAKRPSNHVRDPILVSNLKIAPKRVKLGRKTTVTAQVTNVSPIISSFSVVLRIRGMVEAIKEITLDPGQSQEITFAIVKDKPGSYDIDLENSKGIFTINE